MLGDLHMDRLLNLVRMLIPRKFSTVVVGSIRFVGRNKKGFGIRGIAFKGFEIEPELRFVKFFLHTGDTFLDIGANTGIYALHASRYVGSGGSVLAFEPNIEIAYCLSRAVEMNRFTNIVVLPIGVSDKQGVSEFFHNYEKPNSFSLLKHDMNATKESIFTISLDEYFEDQELENLKYIKIDVEGNESRVILGGHKTIAKYRPVIQVEFTIAEVSFVLPGYVEVHILNSPNLLLVPSEQMQSVTKILEEGFKFEICI